MNDTVQNAAATSQDTLQAGAEGNTIFGAATDSTLVGSAVSASTAASLIAANTIAPELAGLNVKEHHNVAFNLVKGAEKEIEKMVDEVEGSVLVTDILFEIKNLKEYLLEHFKML